jgi:hypothetical protein
LKLNLEFGYFSWREERVLIVVVEAEGVMSRIAMEFGAEEEFEGEDAKCWTRERPMPERPPGGG